MVNELKCKLPDYGNQGMNNGSEDKYENEWGTN
jgi:hypothetical protein